MTITTKDFYDALFEDINSIKNFRMSFGFDWLDELKDFSRRNIKLDSINNTVSNSNKLLSIDKYSGNLWFCPNLYSTYGKTIDKNIKILNAMIIDVDYKRSNYSELKTYDKLITKLDSINLLPTVINSTGHGLQLFFKLENRSTESNYPFILVQSPKIISWYSALAHKLCSILKDFGADAAATNPGRLCRVPESFNFKDFSEYNGRLPYNAIKYVLNEDCFVRTEYINTENRYTLQDMNEVLMIDPQPIKINKHSSSDNIKNMLNPYRLIDLKNLVINRKGNMNGHRHDLLFTVKQLNGNPAIFNELLNNPLTEQEVKNINEWFDRKDYFRISNERIVERLHIADNEMINNLIILSEKEKINRINKRKIKRSAKFLRNAIINHLLRIYQYLYIKKSRTATNKILAKELNISNNTVKGRRAMTNTDFKNGFRETVALFNDFLEQADRLGINLTEDEEIMTELNRTNELIQNLTTKSTKKVIKNNIIELKALKQVA